MTLISIPLNDARWQGVTWTLPAGRAVNTPLTVGGELLNNPSFSVNTSGWSPTNCTIASVAGGQSGNCCELSMTGGTSQNLNQTKFLSGWITSSCYIKSGTAGDTQNRINLQRAGSPFDNIFVINPTNTTADWVIKKNTGFSDGANFTFFLVKNNATAGTMLFDEASLMQLSTPTLPRLITFSSQYFTTIKTGWTISNGLQAGCIANSDALLTNAVVTLHNCTNYQMWKCVAGTWTKLVDVAAPYAADRLCELRRPFGFTYTAVYNNLVVGTPQVIAHPTIISNTNHGVFSTGDGNSELDFWIDEYIPPAFPSLARMNMQGAMLPRAGGVR